MKPRIHPELQDRAVDDRRVPHPPSGLAYTVAAVNDDGTPLITRCRGAPATGLGAQVVEREVMPTHQGRIRIGG